jgi:nicotinamidase/pyrazinamidase
MEKIKVKSSDALVIVDLQNDFCPNGALAVQEGDKIVPIINKLLKKRFNFVVASRDWHPKNHCSFKKYGGIWPSHCVKNTKGAEFHPKLHTSKINFIVSKATKKDKDAYSAFERTNLTKVLKNKKIKRIFVCGLATDYCVKSTAIDGTKENFKVFLIKDAIKGVDVKKGDVKKALTEMKKEGVKFISSKEIS